MTTSDEGVVVNASESWRSPSYLTRTPMADLSRTMVIEEFIKMNLQDATARR